MLITLIKSIIYNPFSPYRTLGKKLTNKIKKEFDSFHLLFYTVTIMIEVTSQLLSSVTKTNCCCSWSFFYI